MNKFYIIISVGAVLLLLAAISYLLKKYRKDKYLEKTYSVGFVEKQITLQNGNVINYAEGPNNGKKALLLIHGQTGAWQDYKKVLPELSNHWHIFAVDCHGHGKSSHNSEYYFIDSIGNDFISFIKTVIKKKIVISGHSSGALIVAYIAGKEDSFVSASLLEDPPIFSTEKEYFEKTFAYHDTYKNIHNYLRTDKNERWEVYYLRNSYWGKLYLPEKTDKLAEAAKNRLEKYPNKPLRIWFLPKKVNKLMQDMFTYIDDYDFQFGENFYNYSWHNNISHKELMLSVKHPCIYLHAKESYSKDGVLMAAASDQQARKAVGLIKTCELIELESGHNIHQEKSEEFIKSINKLL